jgi:hypothetical protein
VRRSPLGAAFLAAALVVVSVGSEKMAVVKVTGKRIAGATKFV